MQNNLFFTITGLWSKEPGSTCDPTPGYTLGTQLVGWYATRSIKTKSGIHKSKLFPNVSLTNLQIVLRSCVVDATQSQ